MQKRHYLPASTVFLLTTIILLPVSLFAQNIWLEHGWKPSIEFEYLKPNYSDLSSTPRSAYILFLSGRYPISDKTLFVVDLPIVHASYKSNNFNGSETSIANPYIGAEMRRLGSRSSVEIGFRLPVISDDRPLASSSGRVTDYDRYEAFLPHIIAITGKGNFRWISASNKLGACLRFGPTIWLSTQGAGGEMFFDYTMQASYMVRKVLLTSGLTGRFFASRNFGDFSNRFVNQIGIAASGESGSFRPGIYFRIPLDEDYLGAIDFVLGLNVGITFE